MKIKKLTSLALVLALAVAFVGCSKTDSGNKAEDKDKKPQTQQETTDKTDDKDDKKEDKDDKDKLENEEEAEESIIVYNYDLDNEKLIENRIDGKKETPEQVFESRR